MTRVIDERKWVTHFGIFFHARRIEILGSMIRNESSFSALDIGSGTGLLRQLGVRSVTLDINLRPGLTLIASAEALPFREQTFDLIHAGEVIEHLSHPRRALIDWIRALRPDGVMVISTPNGILVRVEGNRPDHRFTFSPREFIADMSALGLQVVSTKTIYTGLIGKRVFRFLPSRWKMPILRLPIPLALSYDVVIKLKKHRPAIA